MAKPLLEDLFETPLREPPPAVEDIGFGDEKVGLGFPNERTDLVCPECSAVMRLRPSKHGLFYGCSKYPICKASHGAYPDGRPKGTPGDKATRKARIHAHRVFDRLWQPRGVEPPLMSRSKAYRLLRQVMGVPLEEAHISNFTAEQCAALIEQMKRRYPSIQTAWDKLDDDQF